MGREIVKKWIRDLLPKRCMNCGSTKDLQYHHIVPFSVGGNEVPSNISVLCIDCHSKVHFGKDGVIPHSRLVKDGIAKAKAQGKHIGRIGTTGKSESIMRMIAEHSTQFNPESTMTEPEIMELAKVRPTTFFKYKRMLIAAMQADVWPFEWEKPKTLRNRPTYAAAVKAKREAKKEAERIAAIKPTKHPNGKDVAPWEVAI